MLEGMVRWFKNKMTKQIPKKLVEWKGKGKLKAKDFEAKSDFTLEFYIAEQGLLFFELDMFSKVRQEIRDKNLREFRLLGELKNGVQVSIAKLILISEGNIIKGVQEPLKLKLFSDISINRGDFKSTHDERILFRLSNLEFTGCEKTFGQFGGWSIDHFTINIEGYPIEVRKVNGYKEIEKSLKKGEVQSAETARILVIAKHSEHKKVWRIVNDLCWLMSFAKGNTINPFGEIHLDGNKVVHETYRTMRTEPFKTGDYVIPDLPFELFPKFLEEAYPNYIKYKEGLGLDVILNYYGLMRRSPILDARCVLGYVLLETLSNKVQEYFMKKKDPVTNSLTKSKINKLKKILPKHKVITAKIIEQLKDEFIYPYPSLQDSINKLMKEFKMKYKKNEGELFILRKEFIHKGQFPKGVPPVETFNKIVHFIDRLILHIFGYTGEYLDVSDRFKHEKLEYKS